RAGQHRSAVVAGARGVARRTLAREDLPTRLIGLDRQRIGICDALACDLLREARFRCGDTDRLDHPVDLFHDQNLLSQMPPRPGAMMPSGSIASLSCSRKRRSAWPLKL